MIVRKILGPLVITAALATLGPQPALAQAEGPVRPDRPAAALSNAELITMLDAYALVQAQNALQLDDEQYGRFVARLKRLHETRRRNMQGRSRLLQELRRLTAPTATTDDELLRDRVRALREFDDQARQAMRREYETVDEVLTPRQQARFRLFEERIEQQKLDLLMRARARAARGERGSR
jgi:hypothetical protein